MAATRRQRRALFGLLAYTALVHAADTLAIHRVGVPWNWSALRWVHASGFDIFKFVAWFVVPLALTWRTIDWQWFSWRGWRRGDWLLLGTLAVFGACAMAAIPLLPALQAEYSGHVNAAGAARLLVWTLSWLVGWEFLHRYVLLTRLNSAAPRFGWLAVPLIEGLYHLQKPALEMAGMIILSLLLCAYTLRRRNVLLPFLAHLMIELELIAFLWLAS